MGDRRFRDWTIEDGVGATRDGIDFSRNLDSVWVDVAGSRAVQAVPPAVLAALLTDDELAAEVERRAAIRAGRVD